jgi:hypothetical protein
VAQTFPSTMGSIISPITTAGNVVELHLASECDTTSFTPGDAVTIRFLPAGPGQPTVTVNPPDVGVDQCAGAGSTPPCFRLRFPMPDTTSAAPPYGYSGPAEIVVTHMANEVAHIGPLYQPHEIGSSCDRQPETIFQNFTVLPPPNDFSAIVSAIQGHQLTHGLATLDGSGSLLVPVDWRGVVLTSGAFLLKSTLNVRAFQANPAPINVGPDDVHSFTIDGKPLPPLIQVTDAGNAAFGSSDALFSVIRVSKINAQGQANFDLSYLPDFLSHKPIVLTNDGSTAQFTAERETSLSLLDLKKSTGGVAFATSEFFEGDLNGDMDTLDQVVQVVDPLTGFRTSTGKAASPLKSPIVGRSAVAVGGVAAFIQGESQENQGGPGHENGNDLNSNNQTTDDILRVYTFTSPSFERTPDASRVASIFPAVNRNPLAVDGSLVYYRQPDIMLRFPATTLTNQHLKVTTDGRYFVTTDTAGCGSIGLQRRDGASGLPQEPTGPSGGPFSPFGDCDKVNVPGDLVTTGDLVFAAGSNSVVGLQMSLFDADAYNVKDPGTDPAWEATPTLGGSIPSLQGVMRLALAPGGPPADDPPPFQSSRRTSLYALAPASHALVAFDVSRKLIYTHVDTSPRLAFAQTLTSAAGCTPSATTTCLSPMDDARNLVATPDGKFVYVVASNIVKRFQRILGTARLIELTDVYVNVPLDLAVSPNGRQLYVLSGDPVGCSGVPGGPPCYTLFTFNRDMNTGDLFVAASDLVSSGVVKLVMSPDGRALYLLDQQSVNVRVYARNTSTGTLSFAGTSTGIVAFGNYLPAVLTDAAMSPDSEHLYEQGLSGGTTRVGARLARKGALQAFDATTQGNNPSINASTNMAAVTAGRVAWMGENLAGGATVNLYDVALNTTTELDGIDGSGPEKNKLALSAQAVVYTKPANPVFSLPARVVAASTAAPHAQQTINAQAVDIGATDVCEGGANDGDACTTDADCLPGGACGAVAVFTSPAPSGHGNVLEIYRALEPPTETVTFRGNPLDNVFDFQVSGNIIAFRVVEGGFHDWNCDGFSLNADLITSDIDMFAYDLKSRQVFSAVMASTACQVAGCDAGLPYKIRDGAVYFTTEEADEDCSTNPNDLITTADCPNGSKYTADCLPFVFHRDLNGDGDYSTVLQIFGDSDGDGVFDRYDNCHDTPNTDQLDADSDGLGDTCDPSPTCTPFAPPAGAPPLAPSGTAACQKAIGSASRRLLKAELSAERACLDKVAGGKLTADGPTFCRGLDLDMNGVVDGPTEQQTAGKIAKAVAKFQVSLAPKCPPATLSQLAACGQTASALAQCVSARTLAAASQLTRLVYGDSAVTDPAARACQRAVGKAAAAELPGFAAAVETCLDKRNLGVVTGDPAVKCLGEWVQAGPVSPADAHTAVRVDKAAAKALGTIQAKCPAAALAPLPTCGGGTVGGAADCLRCAAFAQTAALVTDTY